MTVLVLSLVTYSGLYKKTLLSLKNTCCKCQRNSSGLLRAKKCLTNY